jgi:phospholipase/lecithinase/hemolysin
MALRQIKFMAFVLLLQFPLLCCAQEHSWEALYVFGDSYSDSGAGYRDGNGPTAVVYLAASLGIPFTYAGDPNASGKSLNFAVSGAQTGSGDGAPIQPKSKGRQFKKALLGRGMRNQVLDFTHQVKSGGLRFNPGRTLFFLAGGLNDGELPTATTIKNLEDEIRQLYDAGGRYFLVALLPTKIPAFSAVGIRLNPALSRIPEDLRPALPGAHIGISKWGEYFDQVIEKPAQYGIANATDKCAGREVFDEDATPCTSPDTYFYYHAGHPSTAVQRIVARKLEPEVLSAFPAKMGDLTPPNSPTDRRP